MSKPILSDLDFSTGARLLNLSAPASANEPARLADLQAAIEGIAWKDSARAASTVNVTLSAPGTTIDGVTMAANDRVLLKNQTSAPENGLYIWNGAAVPMTRTLDASTADELESATVTIEEGTANAGTTWRQTLTNFTLGSGSIAWTAFGTSAPAASDSTAGVSESATQVEVDAGTDHTRFVAPDTLAGWSGRKLKYAAAIGDGSSTSITVTHNLGTRDVVVALYLASGTYVEAICDVQHTTTNSLTLIFAAAPASNAYRVVVLG